ncbi:MAG: hypothetical protein AAFP19_12210 [Bacteroidota bacterium]
MKTTKSSDEYHQPRIGTWMAIGIGLGMSIGLNMGCVSIGLAIGLCSSFLIAIIHRRISRLLA